MAIIRRKVKRNSLKGSVSSQQVINAEGVIKLARENGLNTEPFDVKEITRSLGIKLEVIPLDSDVSGYLQRQGDNWLIAVNSLHHPRRQRFTIAHELGHYFLHRDCHHEFSDKTIFRNGNSSSLETEANSFAGDVLMPIESFKRYINDSSSKVEDIGEHFGVSAMAVRVRASQLGFQGHGL